MRHSRKLNNKLNRLQERALRIVYNNKSSKIYQLLKKDKSVTIHTRNLQYLVIAILKVKIGISPIIMTKILKFCDNVTHNLRTGQVPGRRHNSTNNFGVESISPLGAKIWALVPENLRQLTSLNIFKRGIKKWNSSNSFNCIFSFILYGITFSFFLLAWIRLKIFIGLFKVKVK